MITLSDIRRFISDAQKACPAIDFDAISICICHGRISDGAVEARGLYHMGKRITISSILGKKEAFAVFLHELGHHITFLQLGPEVYKLCSKYELEVFADIYADDIAKELSFNFERWLGRKVGQISSYYSRQIPALNE